MIRDLGPKECDLTAAQKVLIDRCVTGLGIVRLIEEYVKEKGIFERPGGFLNPALATHYIAYNNSVRLNLQALGIKRKDPGDQEPPLHVYLETKAKRVDKGETGPAETVVKGAGT